MLPSVTFSLFPALILLPSSRITQVICCSFPLCPCRSSATLRWRRPARVLALALALAAPSVSVLILPCDHVAAEKAASVRLQHQDGAGWRSRWPGARSSSAPGTAASTGNGVDREQGSSPRTVPLKSRRAGRNADSAATLGWREE